MDKIQLLQERKKQLVESGKQIREDIQTLADEDSFVELSAFSFSKNEFFNQELAGEGVVTGFITLCGYPAYVVAQNFNALSGGISKANCDKIVKCLDAAEKNETPVVYLLNTHGVQVGEGVTVLEGLAKLLSRSSQLKGVVPQYAIVNGEAYGSAAALAAIADCAFFLEKKSVLALNSPFVLSAKEGKNLSKEEVGGLKAHAHSGLFAVEVKNLTEAREKIIAVQELLSTPVVDAELNVSFPSLDETPTAQNLMQILEEPLEVGGVCEPTVKTVLCRIGGIAVAAVVFDGGEEGVELTAAKVRKIRDFTELARCYALPLVFFDDVKGVRPTMAENDGLALKEVAEYLSALDATDTAKIAVVYKQAIGLGYSLFAAKSVGFDYTCAFANAKIALFDDVAGAKIEMGGQASEDELVKRYAEENSDPIHAAKDGYIDAIIQPQFIKQHLIASLQMLMR